MAKIGQKRWKMVNKPHIQLVTPLEKIFFEKFKKIQIFRKFLKKIVFSEISAEMKVQTAVYSYK